SDFTITSSFHSFFFFSLYLIIFYFSLLSYLIIYHFHASRIIIHYLFGLRERRRMTEPSKCFSFSIFNPDCFMFCIVLLIILAPYVPTTIGFITSIALPIIKLSLLMCSRSRILPPGLHTRLISFIP